MTEPGTSGAGSAGGARFSCPRLIDYILLVGRTRPRLTQPGARICQPELLRRYPPEDHHDFPLPGNLVFFCQPEGALSAPGRRLATQPPTSFVFALTDKDTNRVRYGVCLNFFRVVRRQPKQNRSKGEETKAEGKDGAATDATTNDVKPNVETTDSVQDETKSVGHTMESENDVQYSDDQTPSSPMADSPLPGPPLAPKSGAFLPPHHRRHHRRSKANQQVSSLTSICLITHHPFFASFRECLFALRRLLQCSDQSAKMLRRQNRRQSPIALTTSTSTPTESCPNCSNNNECDCAAAMARRAGVWDLLTGAVEIDSLRIPESVREQVRQLETFILRLLSAPIPTPGYNKIEVSKRKCMKVFPFKMPSLHLIRPISEKEKLLGLSVSQRVCRCVGCESQLVRFDGCVSGCTQAKNGCVRAFKMYRCLCVPQYIQYIILCLF